MLEKQSVLADLIGSKALFIIQTSVVDYIQVMGISC